jgi:capsular polysaccharide export protein
MLANYKNKRVLLLQGPIGPFFWRLGKDLEAAGARVFRITFNAADRFFHFGAPCIEYRDRPENWPCFLERLLTEARINQIFLFGDCRAHHQVARKVALLHKIPVGVFEEGYLRPHFVTLEHRGVNGHSHMPKTPGFYARQPERGLPKVQPVRPSFSRAALWVSLYCLTFNLGRYRYPHYRHHRPVQFRESLKWLRGFLRKKFYAFHQRHVWQTLTGAQSGRFFMVPLQVHHDAQILHHSGYRHIEAFIEDVIRSFSAWAPADTWLVFKHHPMDRGFRNYSQAIQALARRYGTACRVHAIHDQPLPALLRHSLGVVVINSTTGFSALQHCKPVKVMGNAIYDINGLTFQQSLDAFWSGCQTFKVDQFLLRKFHQYLIHNTQINGNFYRPLTGTGNNAGLVFWRTTPWPCHQETVLTNNAEGCELLASGADARSTDERKKQIGTRYETAV